MEFEVQQKFNIVNWDGNSGIFGVESGNLGADASYPTPAHSDYSADANSNRSSLGNLFDPQSVSIWSTNSTQNLDINTWEPLSKTSSSISLSTSNSNSTTNLFPTSPSLSTIKLHYDDMSQQSQFKPLLFNDNNQLVSPSSTQINLNRGIQDDNGGQFRNQLMLSINKRQQQVTQPPVQQQQQQHQQQHHQQQHSHSQYDTHQKINRTLFKTEMCAKFQSTGSCPYNTKCQFAHGLEELKVSSKPKNWKTKMCRSWELNGFCSYGKRCCYKHGNSDDGSTLHFQHPPPQVLKL